LPAPFLGWEKKEKKGKKKEKKGKKNENRAKKFLTAFLRRGLSRRIVVHGRQHAFPLSL
jgi:hypothetical protein